jgi:FkbM family methyltransferase
MVDTQNAHWDYTLYEWRNSEYYKTVLSLLKENKITSFIDIGANVGGVSRILLDEIDTIQSGFLFEPQRENFSYMFDRFKDEQKITCLNCGIYYGKKHLKGLKYKGFNHVGGFTVVSDERTSNFEETNEFFQLFELEFFNFGKIDFVKIDIEGSEWNLFENSSLLKSVPFIEVELHNKFDFNYFEKHLPQHRIPWYSTYTDENGNSEINHLFLQRMT